MTDYQKKFYHDAMHEALELAKKGRYNASPNPCVGALLIDESREAKFEVIARGYHRKYGEHHAEIECLLDAQEQGIEVADKTLLVTLEPCNHQGKTPPCTKAIVEAGIKKVVIGSRDPNTVASGGIEFLRANNVEVLVGIFCDQTQQACEDILKDFKVWLLQKRPFIILKMATTLDGKIATSNFDSSFISNELSRKKVSHLRANVGRAGGVVLVGSNTFLMDNPKLNARDVDCAAQPRAAIMLPSLKQKNIYKHFLFTDRAKETIIFTTKKEADSEFASELRKKHIKIYGVQNTVKINSSFSIERKLNMAEIMQILYQEEKAPYVLCEGGSKIAYSLLKAKLVDEYRQFIAPKVFGDKHAINVFEGNTLTDVSFAHQLKFKRINSFGDDVELVYEPIY